MKSGSSFVPIFQDSVSGGRASNEKLRANSLSPRSSIRGAHTEIICEGFVYKRGDWRNPSYKKRYMILTSNVVTYYKTKEDRQADNAPCGKFSSESLNVECDTGRCDGPDGLMACFAMTPANIPFNKGHVRRILCGCDSLSERQKWTDALTASSVKYANDPKDRHQLHTDFSTKPAQRNLRLKSTASFDRRIANDSESKKNLVARPFPVRSASYHGELSPCLSPARSPLESGSPPEDGRTYLRIQAWMAEESSKRAALEKEMADAREKQQQQLDKMEALLSAILLKIDSSNTKIDTVQTSLGALASSSMNQESATTKTMPFHDSVAGSGLSSHESSCSSLPNSRHPSPQESQGRVQCAPDESAPEAMRGGKGIEISIAESIMDDILFAQQHMDENSSPTDATVATASFSTRHPGLLAPQAGFGEGNRRQQELEAASREMKAATAAFDALRQKMRSVSD